MPSFYPRHAPASHLPLTPPEFVPGYTGNPGCGGMQYQQSHYAARQGPNGQHDEGGFAQSRMLSAPPSMTFTQQASFPINSGSVAPAANAYYESLAAPVLPPMRVQEQYLGETQRRPQHDPPVRAEQPAKDEKPVGGVSAKLDYDMDVMTDFVSEMAQGVYGLLASKVCLTGTDIVRSVPTGQPMPPTFRKWVHQVLQATRLPSATIVLSMSYLSIRTTMLSASGQFKPSEVQVYRLLTIALLLGSKFLDDNTFINRSWSEVSGISVADLNLLETEWLVSIKFQLHRDPAEAQGFQSWLTLWKNFQAQATARSKQIRLGPIDTNVQRFEGINSSLSPSPYPSGFPKATAQDFVPKAQSHYSTPYSQCDPWNSRRSNEYSPASAPHTGPTTPEYYVSGHSAWNTSEGYSRRTMFGFPPISQPQHQALPPPLAPPPQGASFSTQTHTPPYSANAWVGHGAHCNCMYCNRSQPNFALGSAYHSQTVYG